MIIVQPNEFCKNKAPSNQTFLYPYEPSHERKVKHLFGCHHIVTANVLALGEGGFF
jgi:hypothetical protein